MALPKGYTEALWVGGGACEVPDRVAHQGTADEQVLIGGVLQPGLGIAVVPKGEAELSDHWQPLSAKEADAIRAKAEKAEKPDAPAPAESGGDSQ